MNNDTITFTASDGRKVTIGWRDGDVVIGQGPYAGKIPAALRDEVVARLVSWCAQAARESGYNRPNEPSQP